MGIGVYVRAGTAACGAAEIPAAPHGGYIERPMLISRRPLQDAAHDRPREHNRRRTAVPRSAAGESGGPVVVDAPSLRLGRGNHHGGREPGRCRAIGSALAHIERTLENLERGTDEMEALARVRLTRATVLLGDPWNHVVVARTAHDFEDLARALANARRACEKVRRNAGPILAELTAV
jgi:hypothetical protein